MAQIKTFFTLSALIALLSSVIAEESQDNQQQYNLQEIPAAMLRKVEIFDAVSEELEANVDPAAEDVVTPLPGNEGWTSCNITTDPFLSCHDCHTRVVCLPIGGRMKPCGPFKPFCNYGFCTHFPSADCSTTPSED